MNCFVHRFFYLITNKQLAHPPTLLDRIVSDFNSFSFSFWEQIVRKNQVKLWANIPRFPWLPKKKCKPGASHSLAFTSPNSISRSTSCSQDFMQKPRRGVFFQRDQFPWCRVSSGWRIRSSTINWMDGTIKPLVPRWLCRIEEKVQWWNTTSECKWVIFFVETLFWWWRRVFLIFVLTDQHHGWPCNWRGGAFCNHAFGQESAGVSQVIFIFCFSICWFSFPLDVPNQNSVGFAKCKQHFPVFIRRTDKHRGCWVDEAAWSQLSSRQQQAQVVIVCWEFMAANAYSDLDCKQAFSLRRVGCLK